MIKFETINGTLCRMVEQPCPHCGQPEIIAERVEDNSHWWALYQMMQGKKVRYKGAIGNVYWALNQDGNVQYYDMADPAYIGTIRSKLEFGERTWDYHWQIYNELEPEFKVGDWVEINPGKNPKQVEIVEIDGDNLYYNTMYAGVTIKAHIYASAITRKIHPSEVRVRITLEGQVTKPVDKAGGRFWLYYSTDEYVSIELDALSNKDRELVESLLKAQEEKK